MSNPTQTTLSFWTNLNPNNPPVISYRDTLFFNKYQYKLSIKTNTRGGFLNIIGYSDDDTNCFTTTYSLRKRNDVRMHVQYHSKYIFLYTNNYDLIKKIALDISNKCAISLKRNIRPTFYIADVCFAKNTQTPKNTIPVNKLPFDKYRYRVSISSKVEHNNDFRNLIEWAKEHPDVHLPKSMQEVAYSSYGNRYCLVADEATLLMVKFLLCGATNKIDQYMEKKK